jgi:hypothetical protein
MKLPRWLMVSLLATSVLAMLGTGTWWWVTWPQRTASKFIELISHGKFQQARQMMYGYSHVKEHHWHNYFTEDERNAIVECEPRSLEDIALGRLRFIFILGGERSSFTAERSRVITWVVTSGRGAISNY